LGGLVAAAAPAHAVSRAIVMEWEKIKGRAGYELELVRLTKAGREAPQLFTSEEANWKQELAVGNYEIRLRTIDDRGVPGDWGAASPYIVKLPAPKLLSPSAGSEIKPVPRARLHPVAIEWEAVPETKAYLVEILNASDKVVDRKRIEGLSYSRELPVGKSYRARVAALGEEDSVGEASLHAFSVMSSIQKTRLATVKLNRGRVSYESHTGRWAISSPPNR